MGGKLEKRSSTRSAYCDPYLIAELPDEANAGTRYPPPAVDVHDVEVAVRCP